MTFGLGRRFLLPAGIAAALIAGGSGAALAATSGGTPTPTPTNGYGHQKLIEKANCAWVPLTGSAPANGYGNGYGDKGKQQETFTASAKALVCETAEYRDHYGKVTGGTVTIVKIVAGTATETEASQHGGH
jgi:hypothetical protein